MYTFYESYTFMIRGVIHRDSQDKNPHLDHGICAVQERMIYIIIKTFRLFIFSFDCLVLHSNISPIFFVYTSLNGYLAVPLFGIPLYKVQKVYECYRGRHFHHLEASHGAPGEICVSAEFICQIWQNVQSEQLPIYQVTISAGKKCFTKLCLLSNVCILFRCHLFTLEI